MHPAFGRLETDAARRALRALREARLRLVDLIDAGAGFAGSDPTDYDRALVLHKRAAIDRAIADVSAQVRSDVLGSVDAAARLSAIDLREASGSPIRVDPNVLAYAQATAGDRVIEWTDRFASKLRGLTTQVFAGGLTHREYVQSIRRAMGPHGAEHAVDRIVRTELNRAYQQQRAAGDGQLEATGADLVRVWVSQLDLRVRDSHAAIHGQERELGDPFSVGGGATSTTPPSGPGHRCNGPLDPSLPAEEAVNCRCDVLYVPRSEARQPYIRRALAASVRHGRIDELRRFLAARGLPYPIPRL